MQVPEVQDIRNLTFQPPESTYMLATVRLQIQPGVSQHAFGIDAIRPPAIDEGTFVQRGDEVTMVQQMLTDTQTSALLLTGEAGVGKSTLAALLYRRLELMAQAGLPSPKHLVWLRFGPHTTLPDMIAAILSGVHAPDPGFFLMSPERQIALLSRALRRAQESAFIVLDQFELLLHAETHQGLEGRGAIQLFLDMLLQDNGNSRVLLTCQQSPFGSQLAMEPRVRSFQVTRVSMQEGAALLQKRGVQGVYEDLSQVWQRCSGHVFALTLCSDLLRLSGFPLRSVLNSPDYADIWSGDVLSRLIVAVYRHLNPIQHTLMRVLSLFREPVPARGILMVISGEDHLMNRQLFEQELANLVQLCLVQQGTNTAELPVYTVPPRICQYILAHYLEGSELRRGSRVSSSLGVIDALPQVEDSDSTEAQEVAIAAGHMRVASYYQQMAQESAMPLEKRRGPQDIAYLLATVRHLCLGWHWQQACDLLLKESIYESMVQWGSWNALIGLYMAMLPPNGVLTRHDEGLICNHLGLLYDRLNDAQQSWAYYERALAVQRKIGDQHGVALTLTNQGELFRSKNEWQQAHANFEQARVLNQQVQDALLESVLLHNLGILHHAVKDYPQALSYYTDALLFAFTLDEHYNEGMILTNIGVLFYEQGFPAEALAVLFYTLKMRQSLQYATVSYIEHFITTLEDSMEPEAFARLRQSSREIESRGIYSLLGAGGMKIKEVLQLVGNPIDLN